jgi:uncharacterized protein YbaR (Trm112 family)/SAM-dependent methyltransferase
MKKALLDSVCPKCRHTLMVSPVSFVCPQCNQVYPVVNGIPILLKEGHSIILENAEEKPVSDWRSWIRKIIQIRPDHQYSTATHANVKNIASRLSPSSKLLFVGGGINFYGRYMQELGPSLLSESVNLEIAAGPIVDVVADGHDIPFPDNYFNAIICQAVLEHTRDSQRVVAEMERVLKPDGILYAEIPFLAPVHMRSDFRRFTLMGVQQLFSDFNTIRIGVNGAVASSFVVVSINFYATLFSFGNSSLYQMGRFIFGWLFSPIKYLDKIFCKFSTAPISASAVYYLGLKRN